MRDRLWFLIFLEALIAIENGSEDYFETDFILAVNEYLVRRSDISVRMLGTWLSGQNFRAMQEVTDFFNDRYRVTGQFFRDNQLLCRREWQESASVYRARWIAAVRAQEEIPEEVVLYDRKLGDRTFRENPVGYLLSVSEEERLKFIALLAEVVYEYEKAAGTSVSVRGEKSCREFVRDFGNLLNAYIKYPEDPEIQTLTLMVHMDADVSIQGMRSRRAYVNDFLIKGGLPMAHQPDRMQGKPFRTTGTSTAPIQNLRGTNCEPVVPALYRDEEILSSSRFQNDPVTFLSGELSREQCIHFLTMLFACDSIAGQRGALAAFLITRWLKDPTERIRVGNGSFLRMEQ